TMMRSPGRALDRALAIPGNELATGVAEVSTARSCGGCGAGAFSTRPLLRLALNAPSAINAAMVSPPSKMPRAQKSTHRERRRRAPRPAGPGGRLDGGLRAAGSLPTALFFWVPVAATGRGVSAAMAAQIGGASAVSTCEFRIGCVAESVVAGTGAGSDGVATT